MFGNCSVFVGRFSLHAKEQVEQVAQISFENTSKAEFVHFGLDFGDLFRMLLRMKMQIIEQSQSQLGYLETNNFITIFPPTETSGKQVKYRQASSRSCL